MGLKQFIKTTCRAVAKFEDDHGPAIYTGLTIAGIAVTTVIALRKGPRIKEIYDKKKEEGASNTDIVKAVAPEILPVMAAAGSTMVSAARMGVKYVKTSKKLAVATAACETAEFVANQWAEKVKEEVGEKKADEIKGEVYKSIHDEQDAKRRVAIVNTGYGNTLCYDLKSGRPFRCSIDRLMSVKNDINSKMISGFQDQYTLNYFYSEIGLNGHEFGDDNGWNVNVELMDLRQYSAYDEDYGEQVFYISPNTTMLWKTF